MQQITIQFAVRVCKDYTPLHVYLGCVWVVIYVKYITYEGLLWRFFEKYPSKPTIKNSINNIVLGNLRYHIYKPFRSWHLFVIS